METVSRREFLGDTGAALAIVSTIGSVETPASTARVGAPTTRIEADPAVPRTSIRLTVNGELHHIEVEDRWTLVEALRDHLGLTGTKIGCDRGECGACTVLMDGRTVYSCSTLAVWADGRSVQTVEGLPHDGRLDPLQQSFAAHDAPQCGFCTSGQLMSARALLNHEAHPTPEQVRGALSGNLCRCGNYNRYVQATIAAAERPGQAESSTSAVMPTGLSVLNIVGHATQRIDAVDRVTGKALYTRDVSLPGMLYAQVLRSPHPTHAFNRLMSQRQAPCRE